MVMLSNLFLLTSTFHLNITDDTASLSTIPTSHNQNITSESVGLINSNDKHNTKKEIGNSTTSPDNNDSAKYPWKTARFLEPVSDRRQNGQVDVDFPMQREIDDAADLGLNIMKELLEIREPLWYRMGLVLDRSEPASRVADFGKPNRKALELSQLGYAALEASRKLSKSFPEELRNAAFRSTLQSRLLQEDCPFRDRPRCPTSAAIYRTSDGTCNNLAHPWWGAALLPMERFLPPIYDDDIQDVRRSSSGRTLPSAREISSRVHRDKNQELPTVTLMLMQWGQFIDHDLLSTVKSRGFNGSIPRCCQADGRHLHPRDLHPSCLPIDVPNDDQVLGRFGVQCLEFLRSAPATRFDCELGRREQMNQVTSYLDGSAIYGSDLETTDFIRTFKNGKIQYGRPIGNGPLSPPDPPGGELCRSGALSTECFEGGDGRFGEQSGLTAIHTIWVRYHNRVATTLGKLNKHWDDEKIFQETRKIIGALIQHITYREFLPIVVGPEVMELFELSLSRKGFYKGYDERVNPGIANSFATAAFRFGHSLVQNSYVRFDSKHRPLFNNVSLHREQENVENIWSFGSIDRLLLGLINQPIQRRDEFICEELTHNLFRTPNSAFGVDLAAINVQRGRDHGIPPYIFWRKPCGLSEIKDWNDLKNVLNVETTQRLRLLYESVDDIDLFTAGLAEKPVRGGIVGPTFACIIAQQFLNLRKGDRFWYENSGFSSSFTSSQLDQIKRVTFSEILCQTMGEFETVQPFVFLSHDNLRNKRLTCDNPLLNKFDLEPWTEQFKRFDRDNDNDDSQIRDIKDMFDFGDDFRTRRDTWEARKRIRKPTTTRRKPTNNLRIPVSNVTINSVSLEKNYQDEYSQIQYTTRKYYQIRDKNEYTYLFGRVSSTTPAPIRKQTPLEVNIKIQYYPPTQPPPKRQTVYSRPASSNGYGNGYSNGNSYGNGYSNAYSNGYTNNDNYDNTYSNGNNYGNGYGNSNRRPNNPEVVVVKRPLRRPSTNIGYSFDDERVSDETDDIYGEPSVSYYHKQPSEDDQKSTAYDSDEDYNTDTDTDTSNHYTEEQIDRVSSETSSGRPYSVAYVEKLNTNDDDDKFDFRTKLVYKRRFHKPITQDDDDDGGVREEKATHKEGDVELGHDKIRLVDVNVIKSRHIDEKTENKNDEEVLMMPNLDSYSKYSNELPSRMNLSYLTST